MPVPIDDNTCFGRYTIYNQRKMKKITVIPCLFVIMIALACGGGVPENEAFQRALERNGHTMEVEKEPAKSDKTAAAAKSTKSDKATASVKWVTITDMSENSFSVDMPQGWTNAALLHRIQGGPRSLVTAVSTDKNTVIYLGDPRLPTYTTPGSGLDAPYRQFNIKYPYQIAAYVPAETYFSNYLQKHFGQMEGFRIIEKFDNLPLLELQRKEMEKVKINANVTNASYRFQYTSNGRTIHGELNGMVMSFGQMWIPEVSGFCTSGDPRKVSDMMVKMIQSKVTNPQWRAEQDAKHQQTMNTIEQNTQRMTQQHQQRMANIQRSAAAHQQRMADLQQAADARNEQWRRNQESQDVQHEKFLNVIKGEHTVKDSEGNTYQVDNNHDKYFIDKTNNTYIGTDATKTLDDLRQIQHINIDNFENVQIIR